MSDIDECLGSDHGCEDICVNAIGTYNCSCREGYELNDDGRTCRGILTLFNCIAMQNIVVLLAFQTLMNVQTLKIISVNTIASTLRDHTPVAVEKAMF